ncbi:MAG: hypothetical protein ACFFCO_04205 [Promethearchaeota archaeon]
MPLQSTLSRCIITAICVAVVLLLVDFFFFQFQNAVFISTGIITQFTINPMASWGITFLLLSLVGIVILVVFRRRRDFRKRLLSLLADAEQITLLELAQKLDVTPAKIEVELKRRASSKVRKLSGLLLISQGKYIYLGEKLLDKITELYQQKLTRGEIAGRLQMVRTDLDKAVSHLIERGVISKRKEEIKEKVRPSYRRGTR